MYNSNTNVTINQLIYNLGFINIYIHTHVATLRCKTQFIS